MHYYPRFRLRSLFIVTTIIALLLTAGIVAKRRFDAAWGFGPIAKQTEWPQALHRLGESDSKLVEGVCVYGLGRFIDEFSLWYAPPHSPLVTHLINVGVLERTSRQHPKASRLIGAVPRGWKAFDWAKCDWYASPGFGSQHIEGTDLYLLAVDPITGEAVVLHEWYF